MKTIYKKDSVGKIRIIEVETNGAILIQRSWLIDWKLVTNQKECSAKNIGRSNETNWPEQAILESNAFIKDKLSQWYFETMEEALNEIVILPMLAKEYKKEKHKIDWNNTFAQPKLDGMRCLAIKQWNNLTLLSRQGKIIDTVPHIYQSLIKIEWDFILDWELYSHWQDFQTNMSLIKKYIAWESEQIKYHVYDIVDTNSSFNDRWMEKDVESFFWWYISWVETHRISNESELISIHSIFIQEWFEWTIIRWWNDWYEIDKRSSNLLKYKDFIDRAWVIIDVVPSDARPEQWVLVCKYLESEAWDEENNVSMDLDFKANLKFSHSQREEILRNKEEYIWKVVELRYFEYTQIWKPRFPVCVWFRLDK